MKKNIFILSMLCLSLFANAQLIKNDFLKSYDIGENLEKGIYTFKNEEGKIKKAWMAKPGNAQPSFNTKTIAPLTYEGYVESGKNVAFEVEKSDGAHTLGYSLTNTKEYNSGSFYLATMINVSQEGFNVNNANSINCMIGFDIRFTLEVTRGVLGATNNGAEPGYFRFGVASRHHDPSNTVVELSNESYEFGKTHLAVLKYDFVDSKISIFINPKINEAEPLPTAEVIMPDSDKKGLAGRGIRAISIKQDGRRSFKLGGLRFAKTWSDAIGFN